MLAYLAKRSVLSMLAAFFTFSVAQLSTCNPEPMVEIQDASLKRYLMNVFDKDTLTCSDMRSLSELNLPALFNFRSFEGLQFAENLQALRCGPNFINDITPLENLKQLQKVNLWGNAIEDLSPLANATQLEELVISDTQVTDLRPLRNLTKLRSLILNNKLLDGVCCNGATSTPETVETLSQLVNLNELLITFDGRQVVELAELVSLRNLESLMLKRGRIQDVNVLSEFPKLSYLYLGYNELQNISPISSLTNLNTVDLTRNYIQDLSPLEQNPGIGAGDVVDLSGNCLDLRPDSEASRIIATLEARGVTISAENQRPASECTN